MKSQISRITNNNLSRFMFLLIIFIPMIDVTQLIILKYQSGVEFHPAFAFFLTGSTRGHAAQILLLWFLPLYLLLMGSDNAVEDHQTGYRLILISKIGRKRYVTEKLISSFIFSVSAMFLSLLINCISVYLLFFDGSYKKGLDQVEFSENILFTFSMQYPYIAVLLFSLICILISGLAGMLGTSFSLFFREKKYAYTASFFIWYLFVLKEKSLMFLFQPFAEYDFNILIPILILVITVFISIIVTIYFYEVYYDED